MPKQLFQRPAHVNRSQTGKSGFNNQENNWSRKKNRLPKNPAAKEQSLADAPEKPEKKSS